MISSISTRSVRDWRSNEPGAWVIVLMPALSAFLVSGPTWNSVWLLVLWCLCYCVQFSAARWAKSHGRARYRMPMLVYAALLVCAGLPFVFRFRHAMVGSDLLRAVRGVANLCMATP